MNRSELLNGGAYCRSFRLLGNNTATAGGGGDNTEVNTGWIDRVIDDIGMFMSAKLVINYTAALQAGQTLTFAGNFQDASDSAGSDAADYGRVWAAEIAATGNSGGSTEAGTFEKDVDFEGAKEFVRAQITPNLSAGGTDTLAWSAVLVVFGARRQPMTRDPDAPIATP